MSLTEAERNQNRAPVPSTTSTAVLGRFRASAKGLVMMYAVPSMTDTKYRPYATTLPQKSSFSAKSPAGMTSLKSNPARFTKMQ